MIEEDGERKGRSGLASQNKKQKAQHRAIPDIQHGASKTPKAQLANPIEQRMQKYISGAGTRA